MIKKIIAIFLFIISLASVFYVYNYTWSEQGLKMSTLEKNIGFKFNIPDNLALADPDDVLYFITQAAKKNGVNIIRASSKVNMEEQIIN